MTFFLIIIEVISHNKPTFNVNRVPFIILVLIMVGSFNYFPDALRIINRFTHQIDITTGRNDIYSTLIENYKRGNVFFGNGLFDLTIAPMWLLMLSIIYHNKPEKEEA